MTPVSFLILFPVFAAFLMLFAYSIRLQYLIVTINVTLLSFVSLDLFLAPMTPTMYAFPAAMEYVLIAADILLLLYFVQQGYRFKAPIVTALALLQLLLYLLLETQVKSGNGITLVMDQLSVLMFLVINIVGATIVFYAMRYMADEAMTPFRKRLFIVYMLLFLSVMNTIVIANSLLLFFFLFEMTTLASYLLIGFRKEAVSQANALKALWMNQVGGVAILLATLLAVTQLGTFYFDALLETSGSYLLLAVALFAVAALIKGAALPFDSWLLGAMVAPTPVSAILHSATMVKIAPYLILKLSPVLGGTLLGGVLSLTGALLFVAASYLALSRSLLKELLSYSTIAMLGLMVSLAAIATPESIMLAMVLVFFHAFAKALLFLSTGILEKNYRLEDIEEMKGLSAYAPQSVHYIMYGFISLTLPPFGLFMGKLFDIEAIASLLHEQPWLTAVLLAILVGSVLLVLLYFKVASALLSRPSDVIFSKNEEIPLGFLVPMLSLSFLSAGAALIFMTQQPDLSIVLFAVPLVLVAVPPWLRKRLNRFDRTSRYHDGEKEALDEALFYFKPTPRVKKFIYAGSMLLFSALLFSGVIS